MPESWDFPFDYPFGPSYGPVLNGMAFGAITAVTIVFLFFILGV